MRSAGPWALGRDHLLALLAGIDEVVVGVAGDGRICFVSSTVRELVGEEPETFEGRPETEVVVPVPEVGGGWVAGRFMTPAGTSREVELTAVEMSGTLAGAARAVVVRSHLGPASVEDELRRRIDHEERLTRLATTFVHLAPEEFDSGVDAALADLGALPSVDRAAVWRLDRSGEWLERSHVWVGGGAPPLTAGRRLPLVGSRLLDEVRQGLLVRIDRVDDLGDEWHVERTLLARQGVEGLIAAPMVAGGAFSGFLSLACFRDDTGFDAWHATLARSAAGILAEAFARDEAERELLGRARHDPLTGLANRWAAIDGLRQALGQLPVNGGVGVLLFDLDRFEAVNEALGSDVADRLLCAVADRLVAAAPKKLLVARLGGDELVVVAEGSVDAAATAGLAVELQMALTAPFSVGDHDVFVTASVGTVHVPSDSPSAPGPEEVLGWADAAMYRAKARGRNRVEAFDAAMLREANARMRTDQELRVALDAGELLVHYQPEIDTRTGDTVGWEAFVRWRHPTRGLLDAEAFIGVAAESDLVVDLGRVVLDLVCHQISEMPDLPVVRVNLSARELGDPELVATVATALERWSVAPGRLCVEVSEGALMVDPRRSTEVLRALDLLGVATSIDGFGVGNAALVHLAGLPISVIGVDRSFAAGLVADDGGEGPEVPIARAMVEVARSLDRRVRATGIETDAQLASAVALGFDTVQGHRLGRPVEQPGG